MLLADELARRVQSAVAAVEFKSQVGSVGKNFNNRFEEALGTAADTHAAQRKYGAFGEVPPWLAYVFVLQESSETERMAGDSVALFPIDPQFAGLSYSQQSGSCQLRQRRCGEREVGVVDHCLRHGWPGSGRSGMAGPSRSSASTIR